MEKTQHKIGDVVQLKSGGPRMTINDINPNDTAHVVWFVRDETTDEAVISLAALAPAEQAEFTVILKSAGDNPIQVIKVIRELTNLSLSDARDLTLGGPKEIERGLTKLDAEEFKMKITFAGGVASIK